MIARHTLPSGWRLEARRNLRGPGSLTVDLILHHASAGRVCALESARWNPRDRLLVLRNECSLASIAQHGEPPEIVLQLLADDLGFPVVEWTDAERARDTPPGPGRDVA